MDGGTGQAAAPWRGMKLEAAIAALLVLTCAALLFQNTILGRTLTFAPGGPHRFGVSWHGDQDQGGKSEVFASARDPMRWGCRLNPGYDYRFCGYELTLDGGRYQHGLDLSDYDSVSIDLDYAGPSRAVRFYLKNADPRYTRANHGETTKFNRVEIALRPGRQTLRLKLSDFSVAEWWILAHGIPPELTRAQFDNVVAIEFETGTNAPVGEYRFDVRSICLHGRAISEARWYLSILAFWAMAVLSFLAFRIARLKTDLSARGLLQANAQREAEAARRAARTDHLTGVRNRAGLVGAYDDLAAADAGPVAALLIDVDHFKSVNDRFGHARGDVVLQRIAARLAEQVGARDLVGRWGGEEFLAVLRGVGVGEARARAELLRDSVAQLDLDEIGPVTVSIGVAHAPAAGELEPLLAQADIALYQAKRDGRNRVRAYRPIARRAA